VWSGLSPRQMAAGGSGGHVPGCVKKLCLEKTSKAPGCRHSKNTKGGTGVSTFNRKPFRVGGVLFRGGGNNIDCCVCFTCSVQHIRETRKRSQGLVGAKRWGYHKSSTYLGTAESEGDRSGESRRRLRENIKLKERGYERRKHSSVRLIGMLATPGGNGFS